METIVHKLSNGGIGSYPPNPEVVAVMMGSGNGFTHSQIERQVRNFMLPGSPQSGWGGFSEALSREWVSAISNGGLTKAEVYSLFARRIQARRGYTENAVVEYATLPYHIVGSGEHDKLAPGTIDTASCFDSNCHDRYFRDAVMWDSSRADKCRCDMPKARAIHTGHMRPVRNAELVKLDVLYMKALEASDTNEQQRIKALKQTLRDIPQTFGLSGFRTPETLKAAWPTELPPQEG
jgi:hypothetical protein